MKFEKMNSKVSSIIGGVIVGGITKSLLSALNVGSSASTTMAVATGTLYATGSYNYLMKKELENQINAGTPEGTTQDEAVDQTENQVDTE